MNFLAASSYYSYAAEKAVEEAANQAIGFWAGIIAVVLIMALICGCMSYVIGERYDRAAWFWYGFFFNIPGVMIAAIRAVEMKLEEVYPNKKVTRAAKNAGSTTLTVKETKTKNEICNDYDDEL